MGDNATKHTKCDRSGKDLRQGQMMSQFNTQAICLACADKGHSVTPIATPASFPERFPLAVTTQTTRETRCAHILMPSAGCHLACPLLTAGS